MKHPARLDYRYKARLFGKKYGYWGEIGGWIYTNEENPIPVCQGWGNFYKIFGQRIEAFAMRRYNRLLEKANK